MRANLIQYTWKGTSGYSYGYVMITDKVSVEDIVRDKRTKVLWGGVRLITGPQNVHWSNAAL